MLKPFVILLCLYQLMAWPWPNVRNYDLNHVEAYFKDFINTFDKNYKSHEEYQMRLQIFAENLAKFNEVNDNNGTETYGITEFTDMTFEEFAEQYGLFEMDTSNLGNDTIEFELGDAPESWDWRQQGAVGPVKMQSSCGSCWAFSATAVVEGQYGKRNRNVVPLSEQQVVDCSSNKKACSGGFPHLAMADMAKLGGWNSERDYPYQNRQGQCRFNRKKSVTKISGGRQQRTGSEERLKQLVYSYGPVSVSLFTSTYFNNYVGGVATARALACTGRETNNHAVTVVGYGSENNKPYWIIKNSYSARWGEQGYMRLERGTNACGILQYAAVADLAYSNIEPLKISPISFQLLFDLLAYFIMHLSGLTGQG